MATENERLTLWTAVKRTPVALIPWAFVGAMATVIALNWFAGEASMTAVVLGALDGTVITLFMRAVIIALRSQQIAQAARK